MWQYIAGAGGRAGSALLVVMALSGAAATLSHAAESFDAEAMEVLQAMSKRLGSAKSLRVRSTSLYDVVQPGGIKVKIGQQVQVFMKRPDKLHVRLQRDDGAQRYLWYDGRGVAFFDAGRNAYSRVAAPASIEPMLTELETKYAVTAPLGDLLHRDSFAEFKKNMISAAYLGKRLVDGVLCHHLSFESVAADFQLWVTADDTTLPKRFAITYVEQEGEPAFLAMLDNWDLAPYLDEGMFHFHPPLDAESVPFRPAQP